MKSKYFIVGLAATILSYSDCFAQDPTIRELQLKLLAEGFDPKGVDGKWGAGTESALKAYQSANNFPQTGRIEPESETAKKLGFTGKIMPPSTPDTKWTKYFKVAHITIKDKVLWLSNLTVVHGDPNSGSKWNWETEQKESNKGHVFVEVAWQLEGYEAPIGFNLPENAIHLKSNDGSRVKPIAITTFITPKGKCWSNVAKPNYEKGGKVEANYLFSIPKEAIADIQIECMGNSHTVSYEKEINTEQNFYYVIPEKESDTKSAIIDHSQTISPEAKHKSGESLNFTRDSGNLDKIDSSRTHNFPHRSGDKIKFENIKKDADQGYDDAQFSVGSCYAKGEGVAKDVVEAVKWYRLAADQGYDKAQYALGTCYDNGVGVTKNSEEAIKWYTKAASQGNSDARELLKKREIP